MININHLVYIDIKIDGKSLPGSGTTISSIALCEGNNTPFPACKLVLNDLSGVLTKELNLSDGTQILITAGRSVEDPSTVTRQYRVFGHSAPSSPSGPIITVVGIYDSPKFTQSSVREGFKGTSAAMMAKLAKDCGLVYDGPKGTLNDSQTWLNVCKTRAAFAQDIAKRGYIDDFSCMKVLLTSLGVLKYKDLSELLVTEPKFTLYHNIEASQENSKGKPYFIKQQQSKSTAGMSNSWQNYGSTKIIHSLSGTNDVQSKLDVKTEGKYLPLNTQVAKTVERARVDTTPLDCSNVHSKYERALYQNARILALFCEKISVLITEATDIQLFDTVYYRQADSDIMEPAEDSDIYIVSGKTVFIKGGQSYGERLELIRMSVSNKGNARLATQDPTTLREASLPESYLNPTINIAGGTLGLISNVSSIFNVLQAPTQLIYNALSKIGNFTSALSQQLGPLTSLINPEGLLSSPYLASVALDNLGIPMQMMSNNLTSMVSNCGNIQSLLSSAGTQLEALGSASFEQIIRSGLQQASLFAPGNVVNSLAMTLPMLENYSHVSSLFSGVQQVLTNNAESLIAANPLSSELLQNFNHYTDNISAQYTNLSSITNSVWNSVVSMSNNQPIPSDLVPYLPNVNILDQFSQNAFSVPVGTNNQIYPVTDTISDIAQIIQTTNNGDYNWMYPPAIINKTPRYTPSNFSTGVDKLATLSNSLNLIARENIVG
jgi:hypothetical protein